MDNKEFDHLLGDKLGAEQSFDFQEPDWVDLSQKLDEADGRKKGIPFWFWTGLMGLVVLGGILFLWKDFVETKKLVQTLELNTKEKNIVITDTIYHKITITQYDTIQKTIFVEAVAEKNPTTKKELSSTKNKNSKILIKEKRVTSSVTINEQKEQNNYKEVEQESQIKSSLSKITKNETDTNLSKKLVPAQVISFNKNIVVQSQSEGSWKKKDLKLVLPAAPNLASNNIQKLPRKKRFSIGLLGAWHLPENQTILGYTPDGFFNQNSQAFGVRTEFRLTDNWSVTGDVSYQKTTFETNDPTFIQPVILVEEIPTGVDSLNVDESKLSYGIGLKYFLRKHRKIQPYTHVRLQAVGGLKQGISGVIPTTPYSERTVYESVEKRSGIALESVETGLGFQYRFLPNISWQAEGNYHFYLDKIDDRYRSNIGFKTSLLFHF